MAWQHRRGRKIAVGGDDDRLAKSWPLARRKVTVTLTYCTVTRLGNNAAQAIDAAEPGAQQEWVGVLDQFS